MTEVEFEALATALSGSYSGGADTYKTRDMSITSLAPVAGAIMIQTSPWVFKLEAGAVSSMSMSQSMLTLPRRRWRYKYVRRL